jgi:hypothetical protein
MPVMRRGSSEITKLALAVAVAGSDLGFDRPWHSPARESRACRDWRAP